MVRPCLVVWRVREVSGRGYRLVKPKRNLVSPATTLTLSWAITNQGFIRSRSSPENATRRHASARGSRDRGPTVDPTQGLARGWPQRLGRPVGRAWRFGPSRSRRRWRRPLELLRQQLREGFPTRRTRTCMSEPVQPRPVQPPPSHPPRSTQASASHSQATTQWGSSGIGAACCGSAAP